MCGIVGAIDPRLVGGSGALAALGEAMATAIRHRGPDGAGTWVDESAGLVLGHRRLAVVDLSPAGAQPMTSADGRFVLSYNGEVYGLDALRRHPTLADVAWRGHSDTEVIVESVARRGLEATLADIDGMYAFALWDRQERQLHLVRDRMGIKPLFFARTGGRVLFASELKALRAAGLEGTLDPGAVAAFLRYAYVPAPFAIFKGVEKVLPGEWVTVAADGSVTRRRYWDLAAVQARAEPLDLDDEAAVAHVEALLGDAVGRQMIADVPLGAFLSGGIDSSLVTAMMVAAGTGRVRSFSIGFPEFGFDESAHAAAVARHLGTEHEAMTVTAAQALALVPALAEMYDEPFADSSQLPTHLLSALTRRHVTVALSGDGGDELFAGYNRYAFAATSWPRLQRLPRPIRRLAGNLLQRLPPGRIDGFAARLPGSPPQPGDKLHKIAAVLGEDDEGLYRRLVSQIDDPSLHLDAAEVRTPLASSGGRSLVDRMRLADATTYLPDDVLQKVDRASMAVALEVRPPFLDRRVVELAWRLPPRLLIRDGETKWVLRRILDRHVPRPLIERPKMGFGVPLAAWLRGPLHEWAGDLLHAPDYGGGLLRPAPAQALWRQHQAGRHNHAHALWALLTFEAWRRRWV